MRNFRILTGVALMVLLLAFLAGCGKVTQANYDKIETDMTLAEVEGILGKGTEKAGVAGAIGDLAGAGKVMTWGDETKSITVTFANDKVVTKAQKGL